MTDDRIGAAALAMLRRVDQMGGRLQLLGADFGDGKFPNP